MKVKQECESILNKYYNTKKKQMYYSTSEVIAMTGISLRTLKYRIKEYYGISSKMKKVNRKWQIHHDLISYFLPKSKRKNIKTVYDIEWKSFITWAPKDHYAEEYHVALIKQIIGKYPSGLFLPVIEKNKRGVNHVHMISNLEPTLIEKSIRDLLNECWSFWDFRLEVDSVQDKVLVVNYTLKDSYAVESITKDDKIITKILNQYENEKIY